VKRITLLLESDVQKIRRFIERWTNWFLVKSSEITVVGSELWADDSRETHECCKATMAGYVSPENSGSTGVCLEPLSKKFKQDVADERRDQSDPKIERGKDICHCPSQASLLPHA
jgi:hypothetical protein